jgi:hypothetical protein
MIVKGRGREQCRVAVLFTLFAAAGIDAPTVANHEHHRASHVSGTLPMNENVDKQFFVSVEFYKICSRQRPPLQRGK